MSQTGQERSCHHHGTSQSGAHPDELRALDEIHIQFLSFEEIFPFRFTYNLDSHHLEKRDKVLDIKDFRHIGHLDLL